MDGRAIQLARKQTPGVGTWRSDVWRLLFGSAATLVVFSLTGWPSDAQEVLGGLLAAILGYALATAGEFLWHLHLAPGKVAIAERDALRLENEQLREQNESILAKDALHEQRHQLAEEQLMRSEFARKTSEATSSVWAGVVKEQKDGHDVPFAAIMARLETEVGVAQSGFPEFKN